MNTNSIFHGIYSRIPLKQPIFEVLRRILRLPRRVYQHLHFQGTIKVSVGSCGAFCMRHYGYQVENDLFWAGYGGGWEGTSLRLWARLAKSSDTIFDIGANTGVYALAAKTVNPQAHVFAFEPVENISAKLRENIRLNGYDINVVVAGVSDKTGQSVFYEPKTQHSYSASLNPEMLGGKCDLREVRIEVARMDDFINSQNITSVDLVKIDVEKHEVEVLSGFGNLIAQHRPTFLIEVLDEALGEKVQPFFDRLDYVFFKIDEDREIHEVSNLGGAAGGNYLICSRKLAERKKFGERVAHDELSLH